MFNIRRLIAPRLKNDFGQAASIGGRKLARLRPVAPGRHISALNKTGRLVLYGEDDGQAVKIYEAANAEHARFIQTVCAHRHLTALFPPVLAVQDRFLIAAWTENLANSAPPAEALARLLRNIHQTPVTELPPTGFDYWHDLIKPRFLRIAELLGINNLAKEVVALVGIACDRSPRCLMHPDITPSNVVLTRSGEWQAIDNELLTIGGLPLLDLCNAANPLRSDAARKLVATYLAEAKAHVPQEDLRALNAAWFARRLGAEFVAGNFDVAHHILHSYREGRDILPTTFTP
jgi:hypothetical protein